MNLAYIPDYVIDRMNFELGFRPKFKRYMEEYNNIVYDGFSVPMWEEEQFLEKYHEKQKEENAEDVEQVAVEDRKLD